MIEPLSRTFGIFSRKAVGKAYPTFAAALDDRDAEKLTGATRAGWQADYPSLYNFLGPLLKTDASANYEGYSNQVTRITDPRGAVTQIVRNELGLAKEITEALVVGAIA